MQPKGPCQLATPVHGVWLESLVDRRCRQVVDKVGKRLAGDGKNHAQNLLFAITGGEESIDYRLSGIAARFHHGRYEG